MSKRRARNHILACFVCMSSAGQTAWAEENPDKQLTFQDIFRATELRLVQGTQSGFTVEDISGISGTAIAVKMRLPSQVDEGAGSNVTRRFLMFRGVPDELTLTSGFRTRNVWIVAVADIGNLKINIPPTYRGNVPVEILLYQGEAKTPESRTISIDIIPPGQTVAGADAKQPAPHKPAKTPPPVALGALEDEMRLLGQGETHLRNGNVVFARALFEELATRGSARGAFAVAQTYDPAVLRQIGVVGIQGDVEKAKSWYRKAAELGNTAPVDILSSLKKNRQ